MMGNSMGLVEQQKSEVKKKNLRGRGNTLSESEDGEAGKRIASI